MTLRVLWRLTAMNVMMTLEYRGAFFIFMVNTVTLPLISLLVWLTIRGQGVRLPYDRSQLVTYYILLSLASMLTAVWFAPYMAQNIRLGTLSPWLLRPAPFILSEIANNIGEKVVKLPLLLPLVGMVVLAFHADLRLPASVWAWAGFALSLPLAATVAFLLEFLVGLLAFWTQDVSGLIRLKFLIGTFLSGQLIPLALFPPSLSGFLQVQPFRYTLSFPLEILTGRLSTGALLSGFAWQTGYCLLLWICYRLVWKRGVRAYGAVGA
jgi:ABC-2 type transport system permease protein